MKAIIVRHPQTALNVSKVYQGQGLDTELDQVGVAQANAVALRLKDTPIDVGYSSDLKRAWVAAKKIASCQPPEFEIWPVVELRERNMGILEGTPIDEGGYLEQFKKSGLSFADFRPENGESWQELQTRVVVAFQKIANRHSHECVLFVGHGGAIGALLLYIRGKELNRENQLAHHVKNASVTILSWDSIQGKLENIEVFNDVSHLG